MSASATPIFITVPTKYIPINVASIAGAAAVTPVKPLAKRPPPSISTAPSSTASDDEGSSMDEFIVRNKKRRLDHLTWEEKVQRKKLKNRVAAQTSRDRKKAKMEDMEKTIEEQSEQIGQLQNRCAELDAEKCAIYDKYLGLERRFEELQERLTAYEEEQKRRQREQEEAAKKPSKDRVPLVGAAGDGGVGCVTTGRQTGSAASYRCPLQQGQPMDVPAVTQTTPPPTTGDERMTALLRIITLCLLYRTCSKISTCSSSKSLPKAYSQVSAQTWKTLIAQAARRMPKMTAPASGCLDQWWGPQQHSWNPVDRSHQPQAIREAA
ncbi:X-box-binding protein 1 [Anopheles bellator]|uniref:X-box-binding protein 1 n=1 Tax=Anopheles bellator TaxID=139047 RepID=UPI0026474062|nr:X-box-binding protein 1 [Anopheles bellator]